MQTTNTYRTRKTTYYENGWNSHMQWTMSQEIDRMKTSMYAIWYRCSTSYKYLWENYSNFIKCKFTRKRSGHMHAQGTGIQKKKPIASFLSETNVLELTLRNSRFSQNNSSVLILCFDAYSMGSCSCYWGIRARYGKVKCTR